MPDPITLATITAAVSVLGNEYAKGIATEAGKNTWQRISTLFGWSPDSEMSGVANQAAVKMTASPELAQQVWELLNSNKANGTAATMVGTIKAAKVVVAETIVTGEFKM